MSSQRVSYEMKNSANSHLSHWGIELEALIGYTNEGVTSFGDGAE